MSAVGGSSASLAAQSMACVELPDQLSPPTGDVTAATGVALVVVKFEENGAARGLPGSDASSAAALTFTA